MLAFEIVNLIWSNDFINISWHKKTYKSDFVRNNEDLHINMNKFKITKFNNNKKNSNYIKAYDNKTQFSDKTAIPEERA
jgi:hypothetical protein